MQSSHQAVYLTVIEGVLLISAPFIRFFCYFIWVYFEQLGDYIIFGRFVMEKKIDGP